MGFNNTSTAKILWLLIVTKANSCLLKTIEQQNTGFTVLNKWHFSSALADVELLNQIAELLPNKAHISIALASELFHYQQFLVDRKLSAKELDCYVAGQISSLCNVAASDLLIDIEPISNNEQIKEMLCLGALAINKDRVTPLSELITKHKWQCVRFDSIQLVLAWLVFQQDPVQQEQHWGVLEVVKQSACLLIFKGAKLLCQKSFNIAEQVPNSKEPERLPIASKVKQKIEQLLALLNIQTTINFFVAPECLTLFSQLPQKQSLMFTPCPLLANGSNQQKTNSDSEFYALALACKSWQLR